MCAELLEFVQRDFGDSVGGPEFRIRRRYPLSSVTTLRASDGSRSRCWCGRDLNLHDLAATSS